MAIFTLADLNRSGARASSIPRQYHRMAEAERHEERFSVTDAVHLKLKLQALDHALSSIPPEGPSVDDIRNITDACRSRPYHETVYIAGSEEFYLLMKDLSRPDLVADVCVEAYNTMLQGRHYVNTYRVTDFRMGVNPTFSEIRPVLVDIDRLCETDLQGSFSRLENKVKPFPFLQLPAELRLQVYSHLLPREPRLALLQQRRDQKTPRRRLDIMRVDRQLHDEVRKYYYENRTLFMKMALADIPVRKTLSDEQATRNYTTMTSVNSGVLQLFRRCEVQISHFPWRNFQPKDYMGASAVADPIRRILSMLTSLERIEVSFDLDSIPSSAARSNSARVYNTMEHILDQVPLNVNVSWDRAVTSRIIGSSAEEIMWQDMQDRQSKRPEDTAPTDMDPDRMSAS